MGCRKVFITARITGHDACVRIWQASALHLMERQPVPFLLVAYLSSRYLVKGRRAQARGTRPKPLCLRGMEEAAQMAHIAS